MLHPRAKRPPSAKKKGLDREHRGKGEKGCGRAEQDGKDHAASQMAAGAGAGDGEIDHLGREYEGAQDPHQRDPIGHPCPA